MSGVEVLGGISACITLVDFSKQLLDAARDANGLPEAFRVVRDQLPLIARTLRNAQDRSQAAVEDDLVAVGPGLKSCELQAQRLKEILQKVMVADTDGRLERYKKYVKTVGKGHRVETIAQHIFEQLQLLQTNHVFSNVATKDDLQAAVAKLEEATPSLDEEDGTYISNGSGPINVARDNAKQTNNNFSGEFKPQGDMNFGAVTHNHYRSQQDDEEARKRSTFQQLLASLLFDEIAWREDQVHDIHPKTFHWVFDDDVTPFKRWLSSSSADADVFWVGGKAGSGKSTLMKFLADHPKTNEILREWAGTHQLILIKHFFWNSGTNMQQSQLGLMQNLLYQILQQCPKLAPFASPQRWDAIFSNMTVKGWNRKELTLAIRNIMKKNSLEVNFCFFVDGLDEYTDKDAGDHYRLVRDLDTLAQSAQVKLCVSSRPWNVFKDQYDTNKTPKIIIQNHTRSDIHNYAAEKLGNDKRFRRLANSEPHVYGLVTTIRDRADGVFLWVFLVVNSLLRGLTDHDNTNELRCRLEEMPQDLDTYFRKAFNNIETVYRAEAMRALQFLIERVEISLLYIHCIFEEVRDPEYWLGTKLHTMTKAELDRAHDKARSCVNKWCRDLVKISVYRSGMEHSENVSVSHRTVRDFLLTQEMQKEFLKYPICQTSPLKGLCMAELALTKMLPPKDVRKMGTSVIVQAKKCEDREAMTPLEILDDLDMTTRTIAKQKDTPRGFWMLVVHHGLTLYMGQCLDRKPSCKIKIWRSILRAYLPTFSGKELFEKVTENHWRIEVTQHHLKTINILLAKGFDPNDVTAKAIRANSQYNKSAWQQFLRKSRDVNGPEVAMLLLLNGADPDVKTMGSDGCLYDVRQCLLAGEMSAYGLHGRSIRYGRSFAREVDSWLAKARARKAAKSLKLWKTRRNKMTQSQHRSGHGLSHPSSSSSSVQSSWLSIQIRSLGFHSLSSTRSASGSGCNEALPTSE